MHAHVRVCMHFFDITSVVACGWACLSQLRVQICTRNLPLTRRTRQVEVMSEPEWKAMQSNEDFSDFFLKSTRVMERALGLQEVCMIVSVRELCVETSRAMSESDAACANVCT